MLSGVEEVIINPEGVKEPGDGGRVPGPLANDNARWSCCRGEESGAWCNDIRNVEISDLV